MGSFRRRAAVLASLAVVAASCAGGSDGSTVGTSAATTVVTVDTGVTTTDAGTTPPATTTTVADQLPDPVIGDTDSFALDPTAAALNASRDGNDGLLPLQETLDVFAAVYGTVPGADAGRYEVGPRDGTMAVRSVFRVWGELAPDQQSAVIDLLGLDPSAAPATDDTAGEPEGLRSPRVPTARQTEEQALLVAESVRDEIAGLLGVDLALRIDVVLRESYATPGEAIPFGGGVAFRRPYDTCRLVLQVPPLAVAQLTTTIAHEIFHCFQYASPDDSDSVPDWIIEGQAQWAGGRVGGPDADVHGSIEKWFGGLRSSLFGKSYDAVGFYYVLEQAGVNPWDVMLGMLGRSNADAVAATGLGAEDAVRWMGTTSGHADLGPALPVSAIWQISAREPQAATRDPHTVTEESPYTDQVGLEAYSAAGTWVFQLEEELASIMISSTSGAFEFFGKPATTFAGGFTGEFCLRPEGCECGAEDEPLLMEGSEQMVLGVGSLGDGASVSVIVEDIDDGGFSDGHWVGSLSATPITTNTSGAITRGNTTSAPFEFDVADGEVMGAYSIAMDQIIDAPDLHAEGVGTVNGAVTGCWFSPRLEAAGFSFRGTATFDGVTRPFNFDLPFDASSTEPGAFAGSFISWQFDVAEDDVASGSLPNGIFLDFMRSVGVAVNDVEVRFAATRTSGGG
jgi:hypothetical protein